VLHVPCVMVLIVVFLISLVVQLQKHEAVSFISLWPLLAIIGVSAVVTTVLCCAKWVSPVRGRGHRWGRVHPFLRLSPRFYDDSEAHLAHLMEFIGRGASGLAHASACVMASLVGLFVVLLVLRITAHITWSWWYVFAPLYVAFASFCFAPYLRWTDTDGSRWVEEPDTSAKPCVLGWAIFGVPLLAFALLINFKLQSDSFSLIYALIPLFVLDLVFFVRGVQFCAENENLFGMALWLFLDGPLLVFKILLALYAEERVDGLSPALLFIPLYLTQMILLCGCVAMGWSATDDPPVEYEDYPNEPDWPLPPV